MSGANVSPIGRNKEEWFLNRTAITGRFVLGTTPARRMKRRRATPPNLGGEFHSDASRHSGNLIAPAGGSFACTVVNVLNRPITESVLFNRRGYQRRSAKDALPVMSTLPLAEQIHAARDARCC